MAIVRSRIPPSEQIRRAEGLKRLLVPHNVPEARIMRLASQGVTPEKAKSRIEALRENGVPLQGLVHALERTERQFTELVERKKKGMTPLQERNLEFLKGKGISEAVALRLCNRSAADLIARIDYLESIVLDLNAYGVEKIPVNLYEKIIERKLDLMKKTINTILAPLKDRHAVKILDSVLPGWKNSQMLQKLKPATVLGKVNACLFMGVRPTVRVLINYSREDILALKTSQPNSWDRRTAIAQAGRSPFSPESEQQVNARLAVVETLIQRPNLTVNSTWLRQNFQQLTGMHPKFLQTSIEELMDLGVISRTKGHIRISQWFRTGTNDPEEHSSLVSTRLAVISEKAKQRHPKGKKIGA